jgi:hypothetical protein
MCDAPLMQVCCRAHKIIVSSRGKECEGRRTGPDAKCGWLCDGSREVYAAGLVRCVMRWRSVIGGTIR